MSFELFSVRIRIDYSLFLIIALALLLGYDSVLYMLLFSSLHEAGHILSLLLLGGRVVELTFSYYGIGMKHSSHFSPFSEIVFYLSGISVNIILYLIGIQREVNFALAFINLLPLYPLDGGRVLKSALDCKLSQKLSENILITVSIVFIIVIIALSVVFKNLSLMLIALYVTFYLINFKRFV